MAGKESRPEAGVPSGDTTGNGYANGHAVSGAARATTHGHAVRADTAAPEPIAICGMACRLPRGIKTPRELWSFLVAGGDARGEVPASRYNVEAFHDPSPSAKPGTTRTRHGYFLDEDLASCLDTSLFPMPRSEAERMDPQQRLMLEVARECVEDAGEAGWRGRRIGCYVGNLGDDWLEMLARDDQSHGMYRLTGYGDFALSNRVSYEMNLQGPSMTIRTACSASMVALHEACVAIGRGDCVSAIVGGTSLILQPKLTAVMSEQGLLSPDGSCKTFSAAADGYARGEAVVAVFLKPLAAALRDGNAVRAVVRATATNHDGRTAGFTVPSADAQESLIRRAYSLAGLDPADTGYVECHGTGTPVGDPIETTAVARVFGGGGGPDEDGGRRGVVIGSTKPNFGHTEGAAGILSVLKVVLALENRTIPPSIKAAPRNPAIPWEEGGLTLVEGEPRPWPRGRRERASVNSFGLGGANAHAIIDSAASHRPREKDEHNAGGGQPGGQPQLLLFSANTPQSLTTLTDKYKALVERDGPGPNVADVAYTLARDREHLRYRAFAIASGRSLGSPSPAASPPQQQGRRPRVALVFTGQGAQWPQMGADLLRRDPDFAASIRRLDGHLRAEIDPARPAWTIEQELLRPGGGGSRLDTAEFAQPVCTALQIALVDRLRGLGVEADAVVGHSSGEIAAAYAAGALTEAEAIVVAYYRGLVVCSAGNKRGAMAALGMGAAEAQGFLVPGVDGQGVVVACDNSPRSVTISGDADKVDEVLARVRAARPDTLARKLKVDRAYHSHHMAEVGDRYAAFLEGKLVGRKTPGKALFFSSVENRLLSPAADGDDGIIALGPRYWQKNLESPVLFNGAVSTLLRHFSEEDLVLVEVGPHSALAGPLTQIMASFSEAAPGSSRGGGGDGSSDNSSRARYVQTLVRNQNGRKSLLTTVGKLFVLHVPLRLERVFPAGSCVPDLPRYPFNHDAGGGGGGGAHWFESRLSRDFRQRRHPHHDLLGLRVVETTDLEPGWRNVLHVGGGTAWLRDHKVGNDIVFPFAGYVAMAGEAARQHAHVAGGGGGGKSGNDDDGGFRMRRVWVGTALLLSEERPTELVTSLRPLRLTDDKGGSWFEVTVSAHDGRRWTKHCSAEVRLEQHAAETDEATTPVAQSKQQPLPRAVRWEKWFDAVRREGLDLGPAFHNLADVTASTTTPHARGTVSSRRHPLNPRSRYHMHPAVLDSAMQLLLVAASNGEGRRHRNMLPVFCEHVRVRSAAAPEEHSSSSNDFFMDVVVTRMGSSGPSPSTIGDGRGVAAADGRVVLELQGLKMAPAAITGSALEASTDTHAAARLTWTADVDLVGLKSLVVARQQQQQHHDAAEPLEELGRLAVLEARRRLTGLEIRPPHFKRYAQWVESRAGSPEASSSSPGSIENQRRRLRQLRDSIVMAGSAATAAAAEAIVAVAFGIDALAAGTALTWESLVSANVASSLRTSLSALDGASVWLAALGRATPTLRVLELGGRNSGWAPDAPATAVLRALALPDGRRLWSSYTFAARGSAAAAAQERRGDDPHHPDVEYVTLDIDNDPADQGLADRRFDLVVASNAQHAAPIPAPSLGFLRGLLATGGRLLLHDLAPVSPSSSWIHLVLGTTPAWWRGLADGRAVDGPGVRAERTRAELAAAGFIVAEEDAVALASTPLSTSLLVARPSNNGNITTTTSLAQDSSKRHISLLVCDKTKTYPVAEKVLRDIGYSVTKMTLHDVPRPGVDVVSVLDLDGQPFLENIDDAGAFRKLQTWLGYIGKGGSSSGVFWVTRPCHVRVRDPRYAQIIGLARVIRSELLVDFATCEVDDPDDEAAFALAGRALDKFRARHGNGDNGEQEGGGNDGKEAELGPDFEYVVDGGVVHVGRFFPFVMTDEAKAVQTAATPAVDAGDFVGADERVKIAIGTPGRLNTLHWVRCPAMPPPLGDHELEIEMHAVGVNFKDVLVGMNLLEHAGRFHGLEGSGVVRRVGPGVRGFRPGDRVAAMAHNMLSTMLVAPERSCVKIPTSLRFMDAATMFLVYATAQQALLEVGRLRRGESVLVHSACCGVGLAAVEIALNVIGAEVYATVGSEDKARYLVERYGIPRGRIFNSRGDGASFVEGVRAQTKRGRGVDVVLNSLGGELLHESWRCVAPYGRMVEIGKRDLVRHGRLDMRPFAENRSYCCVDIDAFHDVDDAAPDGGSEESSRLRELMLETLDFYGRGLIRPVPVAKEFDAASVAEAFKHLLPGTHIGRVGIRIRSDDADSDGTTIPAAGIVTPPARLQLDPQASYLLVGGLGGLGRAVSTYMVEHEARRLVYLGRSAGQHDGDRAFVAELKSMGVDVVTVRGDVTDPDDVSRAVVAADDAGRPLRGVLRLTTVQADANFAAMTQAQWDTTLGPKVRGTWNLHRATTTTNTTTTNKVELDFFVLFSSMSGVVGLPGQANYAAANCFLDAFVQYRNGLGSAASAVDIGPVSDVGFLSDAGEAAVRQTAALTGFKTLSEQEVLDAIGVAMMAKVHHHNNNKPTDGEAASLASSTFSDPNVFVLGLESAVPLNSPASRTIWKKDRRMAIYHNKGAVTSFSSSSSSPGAADSIKAYLASARADPSLLKLPEAPAFLAREIGKRLLALLLRDERDLNTSLSLADLGLDSLVAIELRAWWRQTFGFDISVLEMLRTGHLDALGALAAERLLQMFNEEGRDKES